MRRRVGIIATGVAAAALVGGAIAAGAGVDAALTAPSGAELGEARIPPELVWAWIESCAGAVPPEVVGQGAVIDADGSIRVEYGRYYNLEHEVIDHGVPGAPDNIFQVDARLTARVQECVSTRRAEPPPTSPRMPTAGERVVLYDWARRVERPCLARRGIEVQLESLTTFMGEGIIPWYLTQQSSETDFTGTIEARLACPPTPAFLAPSRAGW